MRPKYMNKINNKSKSTSKLILKMFQLFDRGFGK